MKKRTVEELAEKITQVLRYRMRMGDGIWFGHEPPLILVMHRVAERIKERHGNFQKKKPRVVWIRSMQLFQKNKDLLEHNPRLPCRTCDQAFEPVIDEHLLTRFLPWHVFFDDDSLFAIHRCPNCGGTIKAKSFKKNDWPDKTLSDKEWKEEFLRRCVI